MQASTIDTNCRSSAPRVTSTTSGSAASYSALRSACVAQLPNWAGRSGVPSSVSGAEMPAANVAPVHANWVNSASK